jgi:H+/Cl- antiporter ClcA
MGRMETQSPENPHGCFLIIAWIVGFALAIAAHQAVQHFFFPLPHPIPEEIRLEWLHILSLLFLCVCSGFLGVWFTWRIWKYL